MERLDHRFPFKAPNCYRRVLALGRLSDLYASRQVVFGLSTSPQSGSGHAWFEGDERVSSSEFASTFLL